MPRIRSDDVHYKKQSIPQQSRREVATRYGCLPGQAITIACPCGAMGYITWAPLKTGRPGAWVHFSELELDHIIPERTGGPSTSDNLQLLCRRCNRRKGTRL